MAKVYRVGTRPSCLALRQVEEVRQRLQRFYTDIFIEVVPIETVGDQDKTTPIDRIEGTDFFTRELDISLLKKEVDFVVHSAKDLPEKIRQGLIMLGLTPSLSRDDVLVSPQGLTLAQLPQGARVGTSSLRRKQGLRRFRPDLEIVDIRGNIEERLALLDSPGANLEAIVLAHSGLIRLGLGHRVAEIIRPEIIKPHPLQGRLALLSHQDNIEIRSLFSVIL